MRIQSNPNPTPPQPTPPPAPKKEKEIPNYTGPEDGLSHYDEKAAKFWRPLNKAIVGLWMHTDKKGLENIPQSGAHMLCFNHQSYSDASLMASLTDRDIRTMAAKEQFVGVIGKGMTAMGAFPVDRGGAVSKPIETMINLMNDGKGVALAPEGRIYSDGAPLHEFKEGFALMALKSNCETVVPCVMHYQDHKVGVANRLGTYLTAGAVVAGGMAAAAAGGPAVRAVAGALTGTLTGLAVGAGVGFATSKETDIKDKLMGTLKPAGIGALLGAAAGGVGGVMLGGNAMWLAAPLSVGAGAVTLAGAKAFNERKDAFVEVGPGIPVAPYRAMEDQKAARGKLTADLHEKMLEIKNRLAEEHK